MTYSEEELKSLQLNLLELFDEVTKILDSLDIPYVMLGGTALGARRHEGFIPWDDDVDIAIEEASILKLLASHSVFKEQGLFLQTIETEPESPYPYMKIRKDDTEFVESLSQHLDIHQGVFIDVFPFAPVPESQKLFLVNYYLFYILQHLIYAKLNVNFKDASKWKIALISVLKYLSWPVDNTTIHSVIRYLFRFRNSPKIGYYGFKKLWIYKNQFKNRKLVKFENRKFYQMDDIDTHLCQYFGDDYMDLPPELKRVNHAPVRLKLSSTNIR